MISNKYKLSIILSMLLSSCSFFNDPKDSENSPVGTWEVTTWKYFGNLDCSGDPDTTIFLDSLEQITGFGLDELQLELTITVDAYMIGILTASGVGSDDRDEVISTGIITYPHDQFCVIWDSGDGEEFWADGGGDGCDACRDYTLNGDELKMTNYNCAFPFEPEINISCLIYTLVKK